MARKKKKLPKQLAILDEDLCTGCEACLTVCPVDCIDKVADPNHPGYAMGICSIDLPTCIGCKLCAQVCPWNCITMVPTEEVQAVPNSPDFWNSRKVPLFFDRPSLQRSLNHHDYSVLDRCSGYEQLLAPARRYSMSA